MKHILSRICGAVFFAVFSLFAAILRTPHFPQQESAHTGRDAELSFSDAQPMRNGTTFVPFPVCLRAWAHAFLGTTLPTRLQQTAETVPSS